MKKIQGKHPLLRQKPKGGQAFYVPLRPFGMGLTMAHCILVLQLGKGIIKFLLQGLDYREQK